MRFVYLPSAEVNVKHEIPKKKKDFKIYTSACLFLHSNCIFVCMDIMYNGSDGQFKQKALNKMMQNL